MEQYNTRSNHEIDYRIVGEEMQYVEVELDPNETAIAEAGSFMMMDDGVQMQTIFGDGSGQDKGVLGKLFSAGKRLLTGESLFMTAFTNMAQGKKRVSFASPYPGKIMPEGFISLRSKRRKRWHCLPKKTGHGIVWRRRIHHAETGR